MSKIEFIFHTNIYYEAKIQEYENFFKEFDFTWNLFDEELLFSSCVVSEKIIDSHYIQEIENVKKQLVLLPNSESLKNYLNELKSQKEKHTHWHIKICFVAESENYIDNDDSFFEDEYEENIKRCILAIVMSILLANPKLDIGCAFTDTYVNDRFYKNEIFINTPIQNNAVHEFPELFSAEMKVSKVMEWIKKYTNLYDTSLNTPIAFLSLTYVLNRHYHESLLYSIIGLESIFVPESKGHSFLLQKRINYLFSDVAKGKIKDMYNLRSKFVHGEFEMGACPLLIEIIFNEDAIKDTVFLATALLLESLRILVLHDATEIKFNETITHSFK